MTNRPCRARRKVRRSGRCVLPCSIFCLQSGTGVGPFRSFGFQLGRSGLTLEESRAALLVEIALYRWARSLFVGTRL